MRRRIHAAQSGSYILRRALPYKCKKTRLKYCIGAADCYGVRRLPRGAACGDCCGYSRSFCEAVADCCGVRRLLWLLASRLRSGCGMLRRAATAEGCGVQQLPRGAACGDCCGCSRLRSSCGLLRRAATAEGCGGGASRPRRTPQQSQLAAASRTPRLSPQASLKPS